MPATVGVRDFWAWGLDSCVQMSQDRASLWQTLAVQGGLQLDVAFGSAFSRDGWWFFGLLLYCKPLLWSGRYSSSCHPALFCWGLGPMREGGLCSVVHNPLRPVLLSAHSLLAVFAAWAVLLWLVASWPFTSGFVSETLSVSVGKAHCRRLWQQPSCGPIVQQQQQLQMSFAWSFLHVGQSMTANLFHSTSAVSGPKAARRLSERVVGWAMCSCIFLACGTFAYRCVALQGDAAVTVEGQGRVETPS